MSFITFTKEDIADMIDEQINKVHSIQLRIGKIYYPYKDDTEMMQLLSEEYGSLEYVQNCVKIYESSMIIN